MSDQDLSLLEAEDMCYIKNKGTKRWQPPPLLPPNIHSNICCNLNRSDEACLFNER